MPDLLSISTYLAAFGGGVVLALKVIAPRTKSKVDDKVLSWVEAILPLLPKSAPKAPDAVVRPKVVDHRKPRV